MLTFCLFPVRQTPLWRFPHSHTEPLDSRRGIFYYLTEQRMKVRLGEIRRFVPSQLVLTPKLKLILLTAESLVPTTVPSGLVSLQCSSARPQADNQMTLPLPIW